MKVVVFFKLYQYLTEDLDEERRLKHGGFPTFKWTV